LNNLFRTLPGNAPLRSRCNAALIGLRYRPMTDPKTKILDRRHLRLRDLLQRYLTEQGFGVHTVSDAAGMDKALARERVDLLVLDLMLPGEDGLSICGGCAAGRTHPLIMLTAKGGLDRIVGLEMVPTTTCPAFQPAGAGRAHNAVLRAARRRFPGRAGGRTEKVSFGT